MPHRHTPGKIFVDNAQNIVTESAERSSSNDPNIVRWWPIIIASVVMVAWSVRVEYNGTATRDRLEQYRLETTAQFVLQRADIEELKAHGHPEHERRITALENQRADRTAQNVDALTKTVGELAQAMKTDHDVLVRLVALLENRQKDTSKP